MGPKGCINKYGYGMAFPYIIGVLGVSGCIIWVIYPLVDAKGSDFDMRCKLPLFLM